MLPESEVGRHCRIKKAIIDRGCNIPANTIIGYDREEDNKYFRVTDNGVTLVTPNMLAERAKALGL